MKKLIVGLLTGVILMSANANEVYEVVQTKFKDGVTYQQQQAAMRQLQDIVSQLDGYQNRSFFYNEDNNQWLDLISWKNRTLAEQASAQIMGNAQALATFALMDENSTTLSYYLPVQTQ